MRTILGLLAAMVLIGLILIGFASCGPPPLAPQQCNRVDQFYAARAEYLTKRTQTVPTQAHLLAYAVLSLATDELGRNPLSEAIFTARDVQACRAGG